MSQPRIERSVKSQSEREIFIRRSEDRGHFNNFWQNTFYTFSFGHYFDPSLMGFRSLRVLNEDTLRGAEGFREHQHRDMEIVSYVVEGGLAHKDDLDGDGVVNLIRPGEFQRITAGTGIMHREFNASEHNPVHFLQFWIEPARKGLEPSYEQKYFSREEREGRMRLVASPNGSENSLRIHQDLSLYSMILPPQVVATHRLDASRYGWLQVVQGEIALNRHGMKVGDGAAIFGGGLLEITSTNSTGSEILLFDLA